VPQRVITVDGQFKVEEPVTVMRNVAWAVAGLLAESCTSTVNRNVPVSVGVPEMVALGLPDVNERPDGRVELEARLKL
jgi:hypothetical protein